MNNEYYKTKDLAETAVLILSQQQLIRIERQGKICWFIFDKPQQCSIISNDYFFGELMVNAREFYQTITRLKNRIYSNNV